MTPPKMTAEKMQIVGPLAQMAVARGGLLDETIIAVYVEDLKGCDPVAVAIACGEIRRTPRREGELAVPEVGAILERVRHVERRLATAEQQKRLQARNGQDCSICRGSGWMPCQCPQMPCGKAAEHPPHPWTARCGCWLDANMALLALARREPTT